MLKNGNPFRRISEISSSRLAEIFFATGIPTVGFFSVFVNDTQLYRLLWFYPVLILAGWHVVAVNDLFFDKSLSKRAGLGRLSVSLPLFFVPFVIAWSAFLSVPFCIYVALTVINWDIYSVRGKNHWASCMVHNFLAGGLHFMIGTAGADYSDMANVWPMALFFAFAMSAGAMHHDAMHFVEDLQKGYRTGAVCFGMEKWWSLGIIPMSLSLPFLYFAPFTFSLCFSGAAILYFMAYTVTVASANGPAGAIWFRTACRAIFAAAGLGFCAISLLKTTNFLG